MKRYEMILLNKANERVIVADVAENLYQFILLYKKAGWPVEKVIEVKEIEV